MAEFFKEIFLKDILECLKKLPCFGKIILGILVTMGLIIWYWKPIKENLSDIKKTFKDDKSAEIKQRESDCYRFQFENIGSGINENAFLVINGDTFKSKKGIFYVKRSYISEQNRLGKLIDQNGETCYSDDLPLDTLGTQILKSECQ